MQQNDYASSRRPWPPIIYGSALAAGLILSLAIPLRFLGHGGGRENGATLGLLILLAGGLIGGWAVLSFRRAGTAIRPDQPSSAIVTDGPYRYSRNPMYLALTIGLVGFGFLVDSLWFFLFAPLAVMAVRRLAIEPEERWLEARFGETYARYAESVRRWL